MKNLKKGWNVAKGYLDKIPSPKKLVEKFNSWEHEKSLSLEDKLKSSLNNSENSLIKQKGLEALNWLNDPSNYEGIKENLHEKIKLGKEKFMQVKLIGQCSLDDIVQIREEGGPLIDSFEPFKYELTKQRNWNDVKNYFKGDMLRKTLPLATLMMLGLGDSSTQIHLNNLNSNSSNERGRVNPAGNSSSPLNSWKVPTDADLIYVAPNDSLRSEGPIITQFRESMVGRILGATTPVNYGPLRESNISVKNMISNSLENLTNHLSTGMNAVREYSQIQENQNEFRVYHFGEEGDGVNSLLGLANKYYPGEDVYTTLFNFLIDNPHITNPNIINNGQRIVLDVNGYNTQFKDATARNLFVNWVGNTDPGANGITFNDFMRANGIDINNPEEVSEFTNNYVNSERANAGWSTNSELSQETLEETVPKNEVGIPGVEKVKYSPVENNEVRVEEASTPISLYNPRSIVRVIPSQEDLNGYGVLRHWNPRGQTLERLPSTTEIEVQYTTASEIKLHSEIGPLTLEDEIREWYNHAEVLERMSELNNFVTPGSIDLYGLMGDGSSNETQLIEIAPETDSLKLPTKLIAEIREMYSGVTDFFSNFSEHWESHLESIPGITITPEIETPENYNSAPMTVPFEMSRDIEYPNPISAIDLISDSLPSVVDHMLDLGSLEFEGINNPEETNDVPRNIGIRFYSPRGNGPTNPNSSTGLTSSNDGGYWNPRNATPNINFEELNHDEIIGWADTVIKELKSLTLEMDTVSSNNGYNITMPAQNSDSIEIGLDYGLVGLNVANGIMNSIPGTNGIHPSEGTLISADSGVAGARRLDNFNMPSTGLPPYRGITPLDLNFGDLSGNYVSFFDLPGHSNFGIAIERDTLVREIPENVEIVYTPEIGIEITNPSNLENGTPEAQIDRFAKRFYSEPAFGFQPTQRIEFEEYNGNLNKQDFDETYFRLREWNTPSTSSRIPLEETINHLIVAPIAPIAQDTIPYNSLTSTVNVDPLETAIVIPQDTTGSGSNGSINDSRENNNAISAGLPNKIESVIPGVNLPNYSSEGLADTYNSSGSGNGSTNQDNNYQGFVMGGSESTSSSGIDELVGSGVIDVVDTEDIGNVFVGSETNWFNKLNLIDIYRTQDNQLEVVINREVEENIFLNDYNLRIFSRNGDLIDERTGSFNNNSSVTLNYPNLSNGNYNIIVGSNGYTDNGIVLPIPGEWETESITIGSNPVTERTQLDKGIYGSSKLPEHLKPVKYELTNECPSTGEMWGRPVVDNDAIFKEEVDRMMKKRKENGYSA